MKLHFAVMGNPIAHSLSPLIHQLFAKQTGRELIYEKILIADDRFEHRVSDFFIEGGKGLNITLPFKQRAFLMAQVKTERCSQAKAANTLWMKDGLLHADNTDGVGLIRDLSRYLDLTRKRLLLLGAGGAARGVLGPLIDAGIGRLTVANRTIEKAQALQQDFKVITCCNFIELTEAFDLIINATSASLDEETIHLPREVLQPSTCCYDLAYTLEGTTPFLAWAQNQGCYGFDGLGMLVEQAAEAFYIWHGTRPQTEDVLKILRPN